MSRRLLTRDSATTDPWVGDDWPAGADQVDDDPEQQTQSGGTLQRRLQHLLRAGGQTRPQLVPQAGVGQQSPHPLTPARHLHQALPLVIAVRVLPGDEPWQRLYIII